MPITCRLSEDNETAHVYLTNEMTGSENFLGIMTREGKGWSPNGKLREYMEVNTPDWLSVNDYLVAIEKWFCTDEPKSYSIERSDYADQEAKRANQQARTAYQGDMKVAPGEPIAPRVKIITVQLRGSDYDMMNYLEQSFGTKDSSEIIRRSLRHTMQFVTDDQ